jgi:hypothetical protein
MLRDVVVHIHNEQPVLADLLNEPAPSDVAVICSNLRTTNGKKPVFVDMADSTFVIPLAHVRFIEIHKTSMAAAAAESETQAAEAEQAQLAAAKIVSDDEEEENDFGRGPLARLSWLNGGGDVEGAGEREVNSAVELGLLLPNSTVNERLSDEIDPELLRRIREA